MDGLHSPFGVIGRIMDTRGWTREQVLWDESWINLLMQQADQPKYVKAPKSITIDSAEGLKAAMGR